MFVGSLVITSMLEKNSSLSSKEEYLYESFTAGDDAPPNKSIAPLGVPQSQRMSTPALGIGKVVQQIMIRPIASHPAIPLRDQIQTHTVRVPLTPFRAPRIELPSLTDPSEIPKPFLMYNPRYLVPIRDQGTCGACWAFAVCDVLADRAMLATGGIYRKNLSVQELLSCFERDGCDGGSPEEACMWLGETGRKLVTSRQDPYKQFSGGYVDTVCKKPSETGIGVNSDQIFSVVEYIPEIKYDKSILIKNIQNMKRELWRGGPLYCAMTVYDDLFQFAGTSVYKHDPKASIIGGHAITIIGYCDKGVDPRPQFKDTGYWICRNSWGNGWPTQTALSGYFMVVMGSNECGIESRVGFAQPTLDIFISPDSTPKPMNQLRIESIQDYLG